MAKLITLFKDAAVPDNQFEHLADVMIHNQYIRASQDKSKVIEFEANEEELKKLRWFADFSNQDILYIIDRDEEIRERFIAAYKGGSNTFGGIYKWADIILIQFGNKIYPAKNIGGMRIIMRLACTEIENGETDEQKIAGQLLVEAEEIRLELLQALGPVCSECEYMDSIHALDIYWDDSSSKKLVSMDIILFGNIRPFKELFEDARDRCRILCFNCVSRLNGKLVSPERV